MIEFIGDTRYGGWYTDTSGLHSRSIVYSFGVGDDISWDLALIEKFGCTIFAFDPDPKSVEWLSRQRTPRQFVFTPEGVSNFDGTQRFYHAFRADKINSSTMRKNKTYDDLPVKKLKTLMLERGHSHIDLLKMDIEGSEYAVLPDIVDLDVRQILVETHERFFSGWKGFKPLYGWIKTRHLFYTLWRAGFKLVFKRSIGDGSRDCDYIFRGLIDSAI